MLLRERCADFGSVEPRRLESVLQLLPGVMPGFVDRVSGYSETAADLFLRHSAQLRKNRRLLALAQLALDNLLQGTHDSQPRSLGFGVRPLVGIGLGCQRLSSSDVLERDVSPTPSSEFGQGGANCDRRCPGRESTATLEAMELIENTDQGVLHDVFQEILRHPAVALQTSGQGSEQVGAQVLEGACLREAFGAQVPKPLLVGALRAHTQARIHVPGREGQPRRALSR